VVDRRHCAVEQYGARLVVGSTVDFGSDRHRTRLDQRFADRILPSRERIAASRLHPNARLANTDTLESLFLTDRPLVSGATYLSRRGDQHLYRIGFGAGTQPLVDLVHRLCRRRDGLVRGNRLLHHGECAVLAWRRAQAQSQPHAVSEMFAMRGRERLREQSKDTAGLICPAFRARATEYGPYHKGSAPAV